MLGLNVWAVECESHVATCEQNGIQLRQLRSYAIQPDFPHVDEHLGLIEFLIQHGIPNSSSSVSNMDRSLLLLNNSS